MEFGKNLRYLRLQSNMSQEELAKKLGYKTYTTIQKWESGKSEPNMSVVNELAHIWKLSIDDLVTKDLEKARYEDLKYDYIDEGGHIYEFKSKMRNEQKHKDSDLIFIFGKICAGEGSDMIEEAIGILWNPYDIETKDLFALQVHGDSMNEIVNEGFYAIIKKQESAENGNVVAVCIDNETAMLKKFYAVEDMIILRPQSTNDIHKPITLIGEDMNRVKILGKMIGSVSPMMK